MEKADILNLTESLDVLTSFFSHIIAEDMANKKHLSDIDKKLQDLLHEAEFSDLSRKEKLILLKSISDSRKERRIIKNKIELSDPCIKLVSNNSKLIDSLDSLSNKIKTINDLQNSRVYSARSEESTDLKICSSIPVTQFKKKRKK